jgi:YhcH/YjgK/YiaL family protein
MILDKIENLKLYSKLYKRIDELVEILETKDLKNIVSTIVSDDISIIPITGIPNGSSDQNLLEAHRRLMDIHITLEGEDRMAYAYLNSETEPHKAYDESSDYLLVKSYKIKIITIPKGYFCIVPNNYAHMALYNTFGEVRKIVIKLAV